MPNYSFLPQIVTGPPWITCFREKERGLGRAGSSEKNVTYFGESIEVNVPAEFRSSAIHTH